jgi:hypothetical protein
MAFNKYTYIEQLMDFIRNDCDENSTYDEIVQYIRDDVDRECTYTDDCYEILKELGSYIDFDPRGYALTALQSYVDEVLDPDEIVEELSETNDSDSDFIIK